MKTKLFTIVFFAMVCVFGACTTPPQDKIVGKWNLSKIETDQKLSEDEKLAYDSFIEELIKSTSITYNSDFSYEQTANGNTTKGKWQIISGSDDESTLKLQTTDDSGQKVTVSLETLTDDEMVQVSVEEDPNQGKITTKNYFKKSTK